MSQTKNSLGDFKPEQTEIGKRIKNCSGSLTETIPVNEEFSIHKVEVMEGEYNDKPTKTAFLEVERNGLKAEFSTGGKTILAQLTEWKNNDGQTLSYVINAGKVQVFKLEKYKTKNGQYAFRLIE